MSVKNTKKADHSKLKGFVEQAQIDAWKKKCPLGIVAVVKDGMIAYFKRPGFEEIDCYQSLVETLDQPSERWKEYTNLLWLGGCEELKDSALYLGQTVQTLNEAFAGVKMEFLNV